MEKTRLGNTGLQVSRICLGTMTYGSPAWRDWVLDEETSRPFIKRALEAGINFFDTADVYSLGQSERVVGRALHDFCSSREDYVLATKVFFPVDGGHGGLSRKHILHAIDNSLTRLGLDHVDLYQIHRFDNDTPIAETIEALHDVVKAGKARYIGASSMYAWQFARYLSTAEAMGMTKFVSMQNFYNLVYREEEREMLPLCAAAGIGVIPWSPLAMSDRLGPVSFGDDDADVFLGRDFVTRKDYSEKKAEEIDDEVSKILGGLYSEARQDLVDHRATLDRIAEALLERETLDTADLKLLMAGRELPPLPVPAEPPRREEPPRRSRPERAKDFPPDKLPDPEPIPG